MNQMKKEELEITISDSDRIECAIRHIKTAVDIDPWAVEIAVEAMERQIPKKPGYTKLMYKCNGEDIEINHPECPYCRTHGLTLWDAAIPVGDKYCKRCGHAIDWEGE